MTDRQESEIRCPSNVPEMLFQNHEEHCLWRCHGHLSPAHFLKHRHVPGSLTVAPTTILTKLVAKEGSQATGQPNYKCGNRLCLCLNALVFGCKDSDRLGKVAANVGVGRCYRMVGRSSGGGVRGDMLQVTAPEAQERHLPSLTYWCPHMETGKYNIYCSK